MFQAMKNIDVEKLRDRAVVVAMTHDEARVWLLNDNSHQPQIRIFRESPENVHMRQAQAHHGHASEIGEIDFFDDVADALSIVSSVILMGHGKGKANAGERFDRHLRDHHKSAASKIAVTGNINIPALGESEIISEARRRWRASLEMS